MTQIQISTGIRSLATSVVILISTALHSFGQDSSLFELRQKAIVDAVNKTKSAIVKLDIFSEERQNLRTGTATFVSDEGDLITSSYFVPSKKVVLTTQWENKKQNIKVVAVDHSYGLALLKLDTDKATPFVPLFKSKQFVGQSVIAHGKTINDSSTNISVGIVSAENRIWGKAIQTDAKTSPANYGGPLTDLAGNAIGILTAIAPDGSSKADAEWYDSGIGFAVPTVNVSKSINMMRKKGDLFPGKTGIQFQSSNELSGNLIVAHCFPRSPSSKAGIQPNDLVVKVNGKTVKTLGQFKNATHSFYSGETISLTLQRKESTIDLKLELASQLSVYKAPYLGILPDPLHQDPGVKVAGVDPSGPCGTTIPIGSVIENIDTHKIENLSDLIFNLSRFEAKDKISIRYRYEQKENLAQVVLGELLQEVTDKNFGKTKVNLKEDLINEDLNVSGFANLGKFWLPDKVIRGSDFKCLVILANSSKESPGVAQAWRDLAKQQGHAVVMLYPSAISGWQSDEKEFVALALRKVYSKLSRSPKTFLLARGNTANFGINLIREQTRTFSGLILRNPAISQEAIIPFAKPGSPLFTLISVEKPFAISGVKTQRKFLQNGIPSKLELRDNTTKTTQIPENIQLWLRATDRI